MKRVVARGLLVLSGSLFALPGCASGQSIRCWFLRGDCITYAQYLSVDQSARPAPTAYSVIEALGKPMSVHDRNGIRYAIDYHAYSLTDELKMATFTFDENENLVKKELW